MVAAGRIISASDEAWNAVRVIPIAALSGEVSGLITALSVKKGTPVHGLGLNDLHEEIARRDLTLHGFAD